MWHVLIAKETEERMDREERASLEPFEASSVTGVLTTSGVRRKFTKPDGRYHLGNPKLIARNRARQVERFDEMVQQLKGTGR